MKRFDSSDIFSDEFYEYYPPPSGITDDISGFLPERFDAEVITGKKHTKKQRRDPDEDDYKRIAEKLLTEYPDLQTSLLDFYKRLPPYMSAIYRHDIIRKFEDFIEATLLGRPSEEEFDATYKGIRDLEQALDPADPEKDQKLRILKQKKQDLDEYRAMLGRAEDAADEKRPMSVIKEKASFHNAVIARDIIQNWLTKLAQYVEDPLDRYPVIRLKTPSDIMVEAKEPYFRNYRFMSILNGVIQTISTLPIFDQGKSQDLAKSLSLTLAWADSTYCDRVLYLSNLWVRNILALRPLGISRCYLTLEDWGLFQLPSPLPSEITRIVFPIALEGITYFFPARTSAGLITQEAEDLLRELRDDGFFIYSSARKCKHYFYTREEVNSYIKNWSPGNLYNVFITLVYEKGRTDWRTTWRHRIMCVLDKNAAAHKWDGYMVDSSTWFNMNFVTDLYKPAEPGKYPLPSIYVGMQVGGYKEKDRGTLDGRVVHALTPKGYLFSIPRSYSSLYSNDTYVKHVIPASVVRKITMQNFKVLGDAVSDRTFTDTYPNCLSITPLNTDAQKRDGSCGTWSAYFCFYYALLNRDYANNSLALLPLAPPDLSVNILTLEKQPVLQYKARTVPMHARYYQEFLTYVFTEFTKQPYGHGEIEDKKEESKDGVNEKMSK